MDGMSIMIRSCQRFKSPVSNPAMLIYCFIQLNRQTKNPFALHPLTPSCFFHLLCVISEKEKKFRFVLQLQCVLRLVFYLSRQSLVPGNSVFQFFLFSKEILNGKNTFPGIFRLPTFSNFQGILRKRENLYENQLILPRIEI